MKYVRTGDGRILKESECADFDKNDYPTDNVYVGLTFEEERELKAFEIIKKNLTNTDENSHYGIFGIFVDISSLAQEDYKLLKEMLS